MKAMAAVAAALVSVVVSIALGQQVLKPPYLNEMPSVERVMREVNGTDPADTLSRQMATLLELKKIVEDMAWGLEHRAFNKLTPEESRLTTEYNKAFNDMLASSGRKAVNATGNYYGPKYRSAVLSQFFSPTFLQLYYKADATEMARQQKQAQPQENIFGADKAPASGTSSPQMGDALKGFAKAITGLTGQAAPDGMRINGIYKGAGVGIGFTVATASVSCEDLAPDARKYSLEQAGTQMHVTIANEGQPIALTFRPDGALAGSGPVTVAGRVQVGTQKVWVPDTVNNTYYGYPTTGHYAEQPIYKPKSARCTFGAMAPTGAYAATVGNAVRYAQGLAGEHPQEFKITPGVRLVGLYSGTGGAIEFEEDSATIKCGGSKKEVGYAIAPSGNQFLVTMDGGGTLALDGGRLTTQNSGPLGCIAGTLALGGASPAGGARTSTSAANSAGGGGSVASGPAILALANGLPNQPDGKISLAGHAFGITREDFATVLTKAGYRPPAGASVIGGWAEACKTGQPACQQGFNAMGAASVKTATLDATGKASFAEVPSGVYYIFGSAKYGNAHMLWNVRVQLQPGGQTITLNEKNAMVLP
jgi:hypothetical protein